MPRRGSWLLRLGLIGHLTAVLMVLLAAAMVPSVLLAAWDHAPDFAGHAWAAGGTAGFGGLLFVLTRAFRGGSRSGTARGF
ncbi:MAG: hypothetical protein H6705_13910 [Myxococcales bacterium]|nr:hypothetical protein [Myxococcales bacterium]